MEAILIFLVAHWVLSVFFQSFFQHRYAAHRMYDLSPFWEKVFYLLTWLTQGSSFLAPRAYAILHREHHAFSDTERDPHSPHIYPNFFRMMWETKKRYEGILRRKITPEDRFEGGYPAWPFLDRLADSWTARIAFGVGYTLFYLAFAPHWAFLLLLPIHFLMGPVHGAIVNWGGHKYGYRNFAMADQSKNTLVVDVLTAGELFQNNHHKFGMSPNFAVRWFEVDPTYQVMRALNAVGIIDMKRGQKTSWSPADRKPTPAREPRGIPAGLPSPADAE